MPTVILLDNSLSLIRPISQSAADGNSYHSRLDFFQKGFKSRTHLIHFTGLQHFLQLVSKEHPLEIISLMTFSADAKVIVPFTRDTYELQHGVYPFIEFIYCYYENLNNRLEIMYSLPAKLVWMLV